MTTETIDAMRRPLFHAAARWLRVMLWAAALGAGAALIFAYAWPAEVRHGSYGMRAVSFLAFMVRTFVFHIGVGLGVLALGAVVLRARRLGALAAVAAASLLWPLAGSYAPGRGAIESSEGALVVYSANVYVGGADVRTVAAQVRAAGADVVLIQEATPPFARALRAELESEYPHIEEASRNGAYGQLTLSRLPFVGERAHYPQGGLAERFELRPGINAADPQIRVVVAFAGREVVVQNIHLTSPGGVEAVAEQLEQARWLAEWGRQETRPAVMMGDFNCTPTSAHAGMIRRAGWRDAFMEAGRGRGATWPARGMLSWAPGVRIDHAYGLNGAAASDARKLMRNGSDHRPIVARFVIF